MFLCIPYRYYIGIMVCGGLFLLSSYRIIFILMVTDTNQNDKQTKDRTSLFPNCKHEGNSSGHFHSSFTTDTGFLFHTAFYIGCVVGMITGGCLSSRFPSHRILTFCVGFTSMIIITMPVVYEMGSSVIVFGLRLLHGLVEAVYQPSLVFIVSAWAFKNEKSRMMSTGLMGGTIGPAISSIAGGAAICYIRWDASFYIYGGLGLLWTLAWTFTSYSLPRDCPNLTKKELDGYDERTSNISAGSSNISKNIPWRHILTSIPVWCIWLCSFNKNWVIATLTMLQPQFFRDIYGLRVADIGLLLSVQPFLNTVCMMVGSWVVDHLMSSTIMSKTNARKTMQAFGGFSEGTFLICAAFAPSWKTAYVSFLFAYALGGVSFCGFKCNRLDLSPQYSNIVTGVSMTGVAGGVVNTFLASRLPGQDSTQHNWTIMFSLAGSLSIVCSTIYLLFGSGERQHWDYTPLEMDKLESHELLSSSEDETASDEETLIDKKQSKNHINYEYK